MTERITENIVRSLLREKGYYDDENIIIEEQKSQNPKINKLLKTASKQQNGGQGYPEFIIWFKNKPDDLIVIECKKDAHYHESKNKQQYKDYAVDGVLLYASYLQKEYNTTAVAVSGTNDKDKKISTFLWLKGHYIYKDIQDKIFLKSSEIDSEIKRQSRPFAEEDLIQKATEYNNFLDKYAIPEVERCTLISAILVSLQNKAFLESYKYHESNKDLINALLLGCNNVLKEKLENQVDKINIIMSEYRKFETNTNFCDDKIFNKDKKTNDINKILRDFIEKIANEILPHINESEFDILGKFYNEFIRYAGNDKSTGLVLTPTHITDFFCDIAELGVDDIVFDPCCGTGGFLVSAMNYMLKKAGNNKDKQIQIKSNQLIGIEKKPDMFSHACSNMMMRGDGKSHIIIGDCFQVIEIPLKNEKGEIIVDENSKPKRQMIKLTQDIKEKYKPTRAFLNPPYRKGNAKEQLEFVENALECILKDGICVAICQMSTATSLSIDVMEVKKRLLEKHTLEAVFSMPDDLFQTAEVNTCILVFKAYNQHSKDKETFFGYFKDDGFVKTKDKGRIDKYKKWKDIKEKWLSAFKNKQNLEGISVKYQVNAEDEWCAEAYMQTGYFELKKDNFENNLKKFIAFNVIENLDFYPKKDKILNKDYLLETEKWKWFFYKDIFNIERGKSSEIETNQKTLLIGASQNHNGSNNEFNNFEPFYKDLKITIGNGGNTGCGQSFLQNLPFNAKSTVNIIDLKNYQLNNFIGIFLITLIQMEHFKFNFGRGWSLERMEKSQIKLPTTQQGEVDWKFMEDYIRSLPYGSSDKC